MSEVPPPTQRQSGVTCSARRPLEKGPTGRPAFRSPSLTSYSMIPKDGGEERAEGADAASAPASAKNASKRPLPREEDDAGDPRGEPSDRDPREERVRAEPREQRARDPREEPEAVAPPGDRREEPGPRSARGEPTGRDPREEPAQEERVAVNRHAEPTGRPPRRETLTVDARRIAREERERAAEERGVSTTPPAPATRTPTPSPLPEQPTVEVLTVEADEELDALLAAESPGDYLPRARGNPPIEGETARTPSSLVPRRDSGIFASRTTAPPAPSSQPGALRPSFEPRYGVLLVSENAETISRIARVVGSSGATLVTARAPSEAHHMLEAMSMTTPPRAELVIVDLLIKGLDVDFVRHLKKYQHALGARILVLSSLSAKNADETALLWGADGSLAMSRGLLQVEADIRHWLGLEPMPASVPPRTPSGSMPPIVPRSGSGSGWPKSPPASSPGSLKPPVAPSSSPGRRTTPPDPKKPTSPPRSGKTGS